MPPVMQIRDGANRTTARSSGFGSTPEGIPWVFRKGSPGHVDGSDFVFEEEHEEPIATVEVGTGQQKIEADLDPGTGVVWRYRDLGSYYIAWLQRNTQTRTISVPKEYYWRQLWYESPNDPQEHHGHSYYHWDDQNRTCPLNSPDTLYHTHDTAVAPNHRHRHPNNGCWVVDERGGVTTVTETFLVLHVQRYIGGQRYNHSISRIDENEQTGFVIEHYGSTLKVTSSATGRLVYQNDSFTSGMDDGIHCGLAAGPWGQYTPEQQIGYFYYDALLRPPRVPVFRNPHQDDMVDANDLLVTWFYRGRDPGDSQRAYAMQIREEGSPFWLSYDEENGSLVAGDDNTYIKVETNLTQTDISGLLTNGLRYQARMQHWSQADVPSGWSNPIAFDTSGQPVFTWVSPRDGDTISERPQPILEFDLFDPEGDPIEQIEFRVFTQEQYEVPNFNPATSRYSWRELIQNDGDGRHILGLQFENNSLYLIAAWPGRGSQWGSAALAYVDTNFRGTGAPVMALTHHYDEANNLNYNEIALRARVNLVSAQDSEFNEDETIGTWQPGPGTVLGHASERGFIGDALRLEDDGSTPAYLSATLRGTGAIPNEILHAMYRLMDSGSLLETQAVLRHFTDQGEQIGTDDVSEWEEQEAGEVPPPPPPETLFLGYSLQDDMSDPQLLDGKEVQDEIYVVMVGEVSGINLDPGMEVRYYFDSGLIHTDTIPPYQALGGSSNSAIPLDVSQYTAGAHEIRAVVNRNASDPDVLDDPPYIANVMISKPTDPVPVYGQTRTALQDNNVHELDGAQLAGPIWILADTRTMDITDVVRMRAYLGDPGADPSTWQMLWQEVNEPYGDPPTPVSLANGDHTVFIEVDWANGTTTKGSSATFNMNVVQPPVGDRWAEMIARRDGLAAVMRTGDGYESWPEYLVDNFNNSGPGSIVEALQQGNARVRWNGQVGASGAVNLGGSILKPNNNLLVDMRDCFMTLRGDNTVIEMDDGVDNVWLSAMAIDEANGGNSDGLRIWGGQSGGGGQSPGRTRGIVIERFNLTGAGDGCFDVTEPGDGQLCNVTVMDTLVHDHYKQSLFSISAGGDLDTSRTRLIRVHLIRCAYHEGGDRNPKLKGVIFQADGLWLRNAARGIQLQDLGSGDGSVGHTRLRNLLIEHPSGSPHSNAGIYESGQDPGVTDHRLLTQRFYLLNGVSKDVADNPEGIFTAFPVRVPDTTTAQGVRELCATAGTWSPLT